ncbi:DUF1707 SHOCT-like domain-containing protein [Kribbella deserti]|uniref:DUF1707 domain-containing protein n=1 Tax=Kribbella deserti TaxID=1926257 RepID=A0ABV6QT43_9ACTN
MENLPERQNPNAHVRASDVDRDQVIEVLRESLMTGRLTQDEHAERLEQVLNAKTLGELEPITHDLVVPGAGVGVGAGAGAGAAATGRSVVPIESPANPDDNGDFVVGIFGGGERSGRWRVKRKTTAICVFGGYDLDMTDAVFEGREVVVRAFAIFGGVDITVPDGVQVRNQGVGIFGGFGGWGGGGTRDIDPNAPTLVVKGLALFGGVGGQPSSKRHRDRNRTHGPHHPGH